MIQTANLRARLEALRDRAAGLLPSRRRSSAVTTDVPADVPADGSAAATAPAPEAAGPGSIAALVLRALSAQLGKLIAMSVFINALSLAVPVFVLQVYDRVVPHAGIQTLKGLLIAILAAIVFDFVLRQARSRLVQMMALQVDTRVKRLIFGQLTGLPLRRLETQSGAQWRDLLRDGEIVRDTVAGSTVVLLVDLPFVLLFIAVIGFIAAPVAWVLGALVPVYLLLALASSLVISRSTRGEQEAATLRNALTGEMVSGRTTVKALNLGENLRDRWEGAEAELIERSVVRGGQVDGFSNLGASMTMLTSVLMTTFGAVAIIGQEMTIGGLIAANLLASRVVQPLVQAISLWRGLQRLRSSFKRLDGVLALTCDRRDSALAHPTPKGTLGLEGIRFGYSPDADPILDGISLRLRHGALHGIVGPNGSGKTTLLKIMQGLYRPEAGRVLLDGADIAQFGRADLARWIGYVPQESFLFQGSIRDNIASGRTDIEDAQILTAARLAGVDDFVAALPEGYDSDVGEAGQRLAGGERQRIALARALVDDPPILLLDEPSSNLDPEAKHRLCLTLRELAASRNLVVVSHSRPLLETCDNLVVLGRGGVVLVGPSRDVLPRLFPGARAPGPAREQPAA